MKSAGSSLCRTVGALGLLGLSTASVAQESEWDFFLGGYLTTTSIDATTTSFVPGLGDQDIPLDLSFSDLLENLEYGLSAVFFARKGKLSLNADVVFVGLSVEQSKSLPPPLGPTAALDLDVTIDMREHELFVGYAAFDQLPDLEIIAGGRYIDQEIVIKPVLGPVALPKQKIGDSWVDPFIGLRYLGPITENWNWILRGDIGGFDVGSKFAWRVDAGASYSFGSRKQWEAAVWYKVLDIDYKTGTSGTPSLYAWDGKESGITLGVGYHF